MKTDRNIPTQPLASSPEDAIARVAFAPKCFPATTEARFTLSDLANACRLARMDYATFLRLRAYLPLSKPPKNQ